MENNENPQEEHNKPLKKPLVIVASSFIFSSVGWAISPVVFAPFAILLILLTMLLFGIWLMLNRTEFTFQVLGGLLMIAAVALLMASVFSALFQAQ